MMEQHATEKKNQKAKEKGKKKKSKRETEIAQIKLVMKEENL